MGLYTRHQKPVVAPTDAKTTATMMMRPKMMAQHIHFRVFL